jgi:beta-aspartyl-peptidase (threonine type)
MHQMATLAIHGGAGTIPRDRFAPEDYAAARAGLRQALEAGWAVLSRGGLALDAVEAAVVALEDHPSFNAGHGAVLNRAREHELDAGIMDGRTLAAGAVASVRRIRNPIRAARRVMEASECVLLAGQGADAFAAAEGLVMVAQDYFTTSLRQQHWLRADEERQGKLARRRTEAEKHGTVGAVALDDHGNLAAATSTGGYTYKRAGRVGDAPIFGAGTYPAMVSWRCPAPGWENTSSAALRPTISRRACGTAARRWKKRHGSPSTSSPATARAQGSWRSTRTARCPWCTIPKGCIAGR